MSSRFHNKFHRHNHHTTPSSDPRYPDSALDPIASPDSPFQGDFILNGDLSASGSVIGRDGVFENLLVTGNLSTLGDLTF